MLQGIAVQTPFPAPLAIVPRRILIIEDNRLTREVLTSHANDLGHDAMSAPTAYEGLRVAALERPDIIIVDGLLPQMHGFELSRLLRNLDSEYHPRIVLMTAIYKNIRYQNEAKLKYGIDTYLIKPVSREQLKAVLS